MALIRCTECKNKVSDKASACPKCGAPVEVPAKKAKGQKRMGRGCMIIILFLLGIMVMVSLVDSDANSASSSAPPRASTPPQKPNKTQTRPSRITQPVRSWTDANGQKIEAKYVSCHNGIVRMETSENQITRVPMWNLSEQDQMFVVKTKGWAVVKAFRQADVKASLDVRLSERKTKGEIAAIANELHGFADNQQPRLFIVYYLPGMIIDSGGWATSHFNPTLEINIIGTTTEEHTFLQKEANKPVAGDVLGQWMDKTAFPGVITFLRKDGKLIKTKTFQDGSTGEYEMVVFKVGSQFRYKEKDNKTSDYVIITANGDMAHGDDQGIWETSPTIK